MAIRIPFYDSKVGMIPEAVGALMSQPAALPMESVEAAGIPGMRLAKAGNQLAAITNDVVERLTHARNVKDFAAMDIQTRLGLDKLSNEIQQDPETTPENWGKRFEEGAAKLKDEVRTMSGSEVVQANHEKMWAIHYPAKLQEITAKGNKQVTKMVAGAFEEHIPQYATLYAQAPDDLTRSQIKDTVDSYIMAAVKAGSITPQAGAKARFEFIPQAMKARVLEDITGDPAGVLDRLKEPEKYYPGLKRESILTLTATANGEMHRQQEGRAVEMQKLYENKQLTHETLKVKRDRRDINMGTYKHFDAALQNDALPVAKELNYDRWAKVHAQAMDGKANPEDVYGLLKAGEFGTGAAALDRAGSLIRLNASRGKGETPKEMGFIKDPYFRLAIKDIEDRLRPLNDSLEQQARKAAGMGGVRKSPLPTHEAGFLFLEACKEAQAKGELTGPWMWKKADELVKVYQGLGAQRFKPGAARPAAPAPEPGAPSSGIPVKNNRTGAIEYVTPAEYDLIIRNQGGRQ